MVRHLLIKIFLLNLLPRKSKKNAFTLIELSIYLAILLLFLNIILGFLLKVQNDLLFNENKNEELIKGSISCDLIRRDLISASSKIIDWDEKKFVFKKNLLTKKNEKNIICIGYKYYKGGLIRLEGDYDFKTKKWNKRIISRINFFKSPIQLHLEQTAYLIKYIKIYYNHEIIDIEIRNGTQF